MSKASFITKEFGSYKPYSINEYISVGGFRGLKKALSQGYEKTIEDVSASGLQGRGGANYPTGKKLAQARSAKGDGNRYVLCNADEGEPGTFKDKYLLLNGIYQVIEGIIIAGYCAGANKGYIYVREEYTFMHKDIEYAISQVYKKGGLGENILNSGFNFDLKLFSGGGSYICGEGFAMCESIEGKSGRPRSKPPYVKECGLFDDPTLVINTETVSVIANLMKYSVEEFVSYGTEDCPGTKMISVSGNVSNPSVFEVEFGTTLKEIVQMAGGKIEDIKFLQIGGASGAIISSKLLNAPYTYNGMKKIMGSIGSGAIVVCDKTIDVIEYLAVVEEFFHHESCGKCVPCREGNRQLSLIMKRLKTKKAKLNDLRNYVKIVNALDASLCGSGRTQIVPFVTAYRYFMNDFKSKIQGV